MEPENENPEWTDEQIAAARPASEVLPAHVAAALVRKMARTNEVM